MYRLGEEIDVKRIKREMLLEKIACFLASAVLLVLGFLILLMELNKEGLICKDL